jgi:hypothetical protein
MAIDGRTATLSPVHRVTCFLQLTEDIRKYE